MDSGNILKIIDFNLARLTDDARTVGFVGTRGYAAPELYAGEGVRFDEKVDGIRYGHCRMGSTSRLDHSTPAPKGTTEGR